MSSVKAKLFNILKDEILNAQRRKYLFSDNLILNNNLTITNMFLTNVLLKKAKSKSIMVMMESVVSGHRFNIIRERLADKLELIRFDPFIQQESLYKEKKKVRSMKS